MVTVRLAQLTEADAEPTANWREAARANLRTPYVRSVEEQREFIRTLPAHRHEYRYWAVKADDLTIGIAGLSPIQWGNGLAEVSLVLDPAQMRNGYGGMAFVLLLSEAFNGLRLHQVVAQVYTSNPALGFWRRMSQKYGDGTCVVLPAQKFVNGQYYDAEYFCFRVPDRSVKPDLI